MRKILIALIGSMLLYACSKSSEDTMEPDPDPLRGGGSTGDTVNMKYAANVVPILSSNCYSCHGAATNSGSNGIVLEGNSNLLPSKQRNINKRNYPYDGISSDATGGPKLSDCNINIIRSLDK